jgi:hypothetical protein
MTAIDIALDRLLRAAGDPLAALQGIVPGDPAFGEALRVRMAMGIIAKSPAAFPAIRDAIAALPGTAAAAAGHVEAAQAWVAGEPEVAAHAYASVVQRWPQDVLALRLAQSTFFYLGWHEGLRRLVDGVLAATPRTSAMYGFVLAVASHAHAEVGNAEQAQALGRQALGLDPACPSGVHAVAHAYAGSGRSREGARWMRDQVVHWAGDSRMRTHNAWHLGMFDAADGDPRSALGILDGWLLPAAAHSALEACDATALLWELTRGGLEAAGRWHALSDAFERCLWPGFWPYVDLHAALAHLAAGNPDRARHLAQDVDRCATGCDHAALRARRITQPGMRALIAWAEGRYAEASAGFAALRPVLGDMGGSRVQLEIFTRLEREASQLAVTERRAA